MSSFLRRIFAPSLATLFALSLPSFPQQKPELQVAATAELSGADQALAREFERETGIPVRFTLGPAHLLVRRIVEGAPVDVFLSDNEKLIRDLIASHLADYQESKVYGVGRVGIWAKGRKVNAWQELSAPEIRSFAMPNPDFAQFGKAAVQSMSHLGLWKDLQKKAKFVNSTAEAIKLVESGQADVAVGAWSQIHDKGGVMTSETLYLPIRETATPMNRGPHQVAAAKFMQFLLSQQGQSILRQHGVMENMGRAF